jgi:hypothetical protein
MEEPLKRLMQELGTAINDSISDSDRIAEAIGEIKRAGYNVFLVLEATVGFNKCEEESPRDESDPVHGNAPEGRIKFTPQDHRFLRALKIAVDNEQR